MQETVQHSEDKHGTMLPQLDTADFCAGRFLPCAGMCWHCKPVLQLSWPGHRFTGGVNSNDTDAHLL